MLVSHHAPPRITRRFWPVFLRNLLVWKKLAIPSLVGNIAEPLMWLVAFGYGMGALVGEVAVNGTGMAAEQARADIAELERGLVEDMISRQPDIVLVNEGPVLADGSSYVAYLSRNPAFAQAWSNYRLAASAMWGKKPIGIYVKASR